MRYGIASAMPLADTVARAMQTYGEWAEQEVELLSALVDEGHTVVEVGGDYAAHTMWLARAVGDGGRVHVTEPRRLPFQQLCANVALNGLANVHTHHAWLGRTAGRAALSSLPLMDPTSGEAIRVESVDELTPAALHLLKINLAGATLDALAGATETIRRHRPMMYARLGGLNACQAEVQAMKEMGYRVWSHAPYLYNPGNHAGQATNLFPGIVQQNVVAAPVESRFEFEDRFEL